MNTNVKSWNRKSLTAATIASTLLLMGAGAGCSSGSPNTAAEYEQNPIVHQVSELLSPEATETRGMIYTLTA